MPDAQEVEILREIKRLQEDINQEEAGIAETFGTPQDQQLKSQIGQVPTAEESEAAMQAEIEKLEAEIAQITPPQQVAPPQDPEVLESLGQVIDRVTLAGPFRKGLKVGVERSPAAGVGAFFGQAASFPLDRSPPPTGSQVATSIFEEMGVDPNTPAETVQSLGHITNIEGMKGATISDVLGMSIDIFGDPFLAAAPIKGAAKGTLAAGKGLLGAAGATVRGAGTLASKVPVIGPPIEVGGRAIRAGARAASEAAGLRGVEIAPDFDELMRIKEKHGIPGDPTIEMEFGIGTPAGESGVRRRIQGGTTGEEAVAFQKLEDKTLEAIDRVIRRSNPSGRQTLNEESVGGLLGAELELAKKTMFDSIGETFGKVAREIEGFQLGSTDLRAPKGFEGRTPPREAMFRSLRSDAKKAMKILRNPKVHGKNVVTEATDIMNRLEGVQEAAHKSFSATVDAWQAIGKSAFAKPRAGVQIEPEDQKALQSIYFKIGDALMETVRREIEGGEAIAQEIARNNAILSNFFSTSSQLQSAIGSKKAGEKIYQAVMFGDSETVKGVQSLLDPNGTAMSNAKELLLTSFRGDGVPDLRRSLKNKRSRTAMERWAPESVPEFEELVQFYDRIGTRQQAPGLGMSGIRAKERTERAMDAFIDEAVDSVRRENAKRRAAEAARATKATAPPGRVQKVVKGLDALHPLAGGIRAAGTQEKEERLGIRPPQRIGR